MQVQEIRVQKLAWEEAISMGLVLREKKDESQWELGDLAIRVEDEYGVDAIKDLAIAIGIHKKTLQQYRRTSLAFPEPTRRKVLSHRHHLMLAPREDRISWLEHAEDNNLSVAQLALALNEADGKPSDPKPDKPEVIQCSTCKGWKMETDKICTCFKYGKV